MASNSLCVPRGELSSSSIPRIWDDAHLPAFLATERGGAAKEKLAKHFRKQRQLLEERVHAYGANNSAALFYSLRARGLEAHVLGLDATQLQLDDATADGEMEGLLTLLDMRATPLESHLLRCDVPLQRNTCARTRGRRSKLGLTASELRWHDQLRDDGVLFVHDWGVDTRALAAQAHASLARSAAAQLAKRSKHESSQHNNKMNGDGPFASFDARGVPLSSFETLPAIEPILHNASIARVISAYLGGPVRFENGYNLIRYPPHFSPAEFPAGEWHHDRCGRRLKLFYYVEDVYEHSHPTQVAKGTQNLLYYTHGEPWQLLSRYSDKHVRSRHDVISLAGGAGGGFLFDTNALHKALYREGNFSRTVVIMEFQPHNKVGPLLGYNNPCPSAKRDKPKREWVNGRPGYPLYPQEMIDVRNK